MPDVFGLPVVFNQDDPYIYNALLEILETGVQLKSTSFIRFTGRRILAMADCGPNIHGEYRAYYYSITQIEVVGYVPAKTFFPDISNY